MAFRYSNVCMLDLKHEWLHIKSNICSMCPENFIFFHGNNTYYIVIAVYLFVMAHVLRNYGEVVFV